MSFSRVRAGVALGSLLSTVACGSAAPDDVGHNRGNDNGAFVSPPTASLSQAAPSTAPPGISDPTPAGPVPSDSVAPAASTPDIPVFTFPEGCSELRFNLDQLPAVSDGRVAIDVQSSATEGGPYEMATLQVEVLQSPTEDDTEVFSYQRDIEAYEATGVEAWDRELVPPAACVVRLVGASERCGYNVRSSLTSPLDAGHSIGWFGYNEFAWERPEWCQLQPGCTSDKLGAPDNWWYVVPDGPDAVFVWCSSACAGDTNLTLRPSDHDLCPELP